MKLAPPSTYPAWGGGRGARRGGPAVEGLLKKCEFVAGGGAGAEGPLAGKLCSTDMPPLPHTDPFLPEGPAFLCLLPSPFSLHLESRATFPAFPCPPPRVPFFGDRGLPRLYRSLSCHRHPSPSARVSCHPFRRAPRASAVGFGADPRCCRYFFGGEGGGVKTV